MMLCLVCEVAVLSAKGRAVGPEAVSVCLHNVVLGEPPLVAKLTEVVLTALAVIHDVIDSKWGGPVLGVVIGTVVAVPHPSGLWVGLAWICHHEHMLRVEWMWCGRGRETGGTEGEHAAGVSTGVVQVERELTRAARAVDPVAATFSLFGYKAVEVKMMRLPRETFEAEIKRTPVAVE